jgi:outer membrane protein TolC
MTNRLLPAALVVFPFLAGPPAAAGQPPATAPPTDLAALQDAAVGRDPRLREVDLQAEATELRLENIEADRLPSFAAEGHAQYQSDVPHSPLLGPAGEALFAPAKDTYDAALRVDAPLVDPTIEPRLAVERARRDEAQARVRTTLYELRQDVNEAFFAAALLQEQRAAVEAAIADLDTRLNETSVRVREGAAIPAEAAGLEAALIERRQDLAETAASRHAALERLESLTGRTMGDDTTLDVPDLAATVDRARADLDELRARPEYEQFARTRERLSRQQEAASATDRPRLSAFATVGYGQPGLNFVDDEFEGYWLAGMRVRWAPWDRGTSGREREALSREQAIVAAEEAAFTARLRRVIQSDLANIDRLRAAGGEDDRLVALREDVVRSAGVQLREGAVTGIDYVTRNTELLNARVSRARHRVELAQAGARLLTTLGLEVR